MKIPNKRELQLSDIEFKGFMKLFKDYTHESYSFSLNDTILPSDNHFRFRKNLFKMTATEKIKTINNKIEQNKAHYNLDKQTAKILALSS